MNALRTSLAKDSIEKEEHNIEISETPKLFKIQRIMPIAEHELENCRAKLPMALCGKQRNLPLYMAQSDRNFIICRSNFRALKQFVASTSDYVSQFF